MNPTIIFDMDGVIVKSEQLWNHYETDYFARILKPAIAKELTGKTRGLSEGQIFDLAKQYGHTGTKEDFFAGYDVLAQTLYRQAPLTNRIDQLIGFLAKEHVRLGLVSSSPKNWIQIVLDRLKN